MPSRRVMFASLLFCAACSTTDQPASHSTAVYDPFEGFNRGVYAFNERADKAILEPAANGYRAITTPPIRAGVSNFLTHLNEPIVFTNALLQGKPTAAIDTAARFLVNSTLGVGGFLDPATAWNVPKHDEDFGQTLGIWGIDNGPYLVLPFMGGSNLRDVFSMGFDAAINPINYANFEGDSLFRGSTAIAGAVATRERLSAAIEVLREQPEPYIALRRNYTQQRAAAIRDGREQDDPFQDLPEFDAYEFGDE